MPHKPLPLSQIGINCVLNATLIHFSKTVVFVQNPILAAILDAILNFKHTSDIMLMICILAVAKKIISTVFSVVKALKFPFNAFYPNMMFWRPFWQPF